MQTNRRKPATLSRRKVLPAAAAISFSLTFVGAGLAMLFGLIPARTLIGSSELDTSVILLFVPLCALILALLFEVARATLGDGLKSAPPRQPNPLAAWRPGNREG